MEHQVVETWCVSRDRLLDGVTEFLASGIPVALGKLVRGVLDEARHDVLARRRDRWVARAPEADVDVRLGAESTRTRVVVGPLQVVDGGRDRDHAAMDIGRTLVACE